MGGGSHSGDIPKFPLHGMHHANSIKNICVAVTLSVTAAICFKIFYAKPRRDAYDAYYSYYDPIEVFQAMREDGYLQSCKPAPKEDPNDPKNKKKK